MHARTDEQASTQAVDAIEARCMLCNAVVTRRRYSGLRDRLRRTEQRFDFLECDRCGSLSISPPPDSSLISELYDEAYHVRSDTDGVWLSRLLRSISWNALMLPVYREGARRVIAASGISSGRLIEIGCSSGYQLLEFLRLGDFEAEGIDVDAAAVRHANSRLGLPVRLGDIEQGGLEGNSYDLVVLFNVFEHLANPNRVLSEIHRILKPRGWLALKTHLRESIQGKVLGSRWQVATEVPRHTLIASRPAVLNSLRRVGLIPRSTFSAPVLENAVSIALSLFPQGTEKISFRLEDQLARYGFRVLGMMAVILSTPLAAIEIAARASGGIVYLAQKASTSDG